MRKQRPKLNHNFVQGFMGRDECGFIIEGDTWTTADPYYCRLPRSAHER